MNFQSFRRQGRVLSSAFAVMCLAAAGDSVLVGQAHAQAAVITGNQETVATVETIDPHSGELLLRNQDGGLLTAEVPPHAKNLPTFKPGDLLKIRYYQTLAATIALPGSSEPESTITEARNYVHRHPHGTLISFHRERLKIVAIDVDQHMVTVRDDTGRKRTITVRQRNFMPLLHRLKTGQDVDVTTSDAITFLILNRTVSPQMQVEERAGPVVIADPVPRGR
ncbi:preprotein translocase subunit YajC [Acetobacter sp. AN02]|uniref:preprotein translocase subunit YajC n=1 Tax=Acetobacter sp. AN02 TaxID=2894186 RepID=UPI00243464CD|nr:preprotein translocase subunit YajC [Acetobacter sp. AN02]MDG6094749.1 preprotein translocase subunit YajC [Acetobacter sp. AN02]